MRWRDTLIGAWALLSLSVPLGLAVNHARGLPLPPMGPFHSRAPIVDLVLAQRLGAAWVDARPANEYRQGHIPGARSWPTTDLIPKGGAIDPRQPMVVYCGAQCGLANQLALRLRRQGFAQVYVLKGSLEAWRQPGNPLSRGDQP